MRRWEAALRAANKRAERDTADAWQRGQAAIENGDDRAAIRWMERACRLSPRDPVLRYGLATAWLKRDPAHAATLFAALAERHDARDLWYGLASAQLRAGNRAAARQALREALMRHAAPDGEGWRALADAIAPDGWCALRGGGVLLHGPAGQPRPAYFLDGRPVRGSREAELLAGRGHRLDARAGEAELLGSPIDLLAVRRLEGIVGWDGTALSGWAWHPGDAERPPSLTVRPAQGREKRVKLGEHVPDMPVGLVSRPWRIAIKLRSSAGPFRVFGVDGEELSGSPVDPAAERSSLPARPAPARTPPHRPTDIIIPVYRDHAASMACLQSVLAARPRGARVIVVDDATPEPELAADLDRLAARRRIMLIRHRRNQGFPAAANAGLRRARADGHDAMLLNADTLVAPDFLPRLRAAAYAAPDIGTACPLSNNATILSYPDPAASNPMPDQAGTRRLADLAWDVHGAATVDIPTAVGFCAYIRHDCLRAVGLFRAELFGRGYGEENDFSMRAAESGWRHVAAPGVFVAHAGEKSFGAQAIGWRSRNSEVLSRLHPDYLDRVQAHIAADPLLAARRALEAACWHSKRPAGRRAVLLVTHAYGGGVARSLADHADALRVRGEWPIILSPVAFHRNSVGVAGHPNLRYRLPEEEDALLAELHAARIAGIEFHHLVGHDPRILDWPEKLSVPYSVQVHDYHWFCPRITLSGPDRHYCGEPDLAGCQACIRKRGSLLEERIGVAALRERSARVLAGASAVTTPSADAAARLRRHFPGVMPRVAAPVEPPYPPLIQPSPQGPRRIAVVGAIGIEKGLNVLLALARAAKADKQPLEFILVGHSDNDAALLRAGRTFVTGHYPPEEATALIRAQRADLALLPSVVPETWSHTLTECWEAGLGVVAFDLGAPAERIRATGRGLLIPPGMPADAINRILLTVSW